MIAVARLFILIWMHFLLPSKERDNPSLKGQACRDWPGPSSVRWERCGLDLVTMKARKYGIHSAMSSKRSAGPLSSSDFLSLEIMKSIPRSGQDLFVSYFQALYRSDQPMSIDEAYLDVTENKIQSKSAVKNRSLDSACDLGRLHLTASAGVSYNKFLAKMASDYQKPRGNLPEDAEDFLSQMDIAKFHGSGKEDSERLHEMGVYTGADLLAIPRMTMIDRF